MLCAHEGKLKIIKVKKNSKSNLKTHVGRHGKETWTRIICLKNERAKISYPITIDLKITALSSDDSAARPAAKSTQMKAPAISINNASDNVLKSIVAKQKRPRKQSKWECKNCMAQNEKVSWK